MATEDLQGRVVVITGASSGIGRQTALKYAAARATVVLAARREAVLDELASECDNLGGRALVVPTDVSKQSAVEQLAAATIQAFGRIDIWINNAGNGAIGRFDQVPLEAHVQVIETDLLGTLYGSYAALTQFHRQGGGILINVASVLGKIPSPYFSSYVAAKHGVIGLSTALRQELEVNKIEGIRICTVMPVSMDTPFFEHAADYTGHKVVPIPPVYDPEQVVETLFRLATRPEDEVAVGGVAGSGFVLFHNLFPDLTESILARLTHHEQMEKAPPAPDTEGNLAEPVEAGSTVGG